jgi:hypothetical protein
VTTAEERRRYPRTRVSWPVRLAIDDNLLVGRAIDVSEQGLCIVTAPTGSLKRGQSCRLNVILNAVDAFSCNAEIRYVGDAMVGVQTAERLHLT